VISGNRRGIMLRSAKDIGIQNNLIALNILYGLHADGSANGALSLEGNVFLNNPVGARFESGQINLAGGASNSFIVTDDYYAPYDGGDVYLKSFEGEQEEYVEKEMQVVGLQFDGAPTVLTITGETLGSTIFSGYGSRPVGTSYYVRIEDGAILDTVTNLPIVIDGTFASWDGLVPDDFAGFLTSEQRQDIEDRLYDADDEVVDGRGQIFVGSVPTPITFQALDNIQDFFREYETSSQSTNRASVRVTGLPSIGALGGGTEANLNDIAPAAGEETSPDALASISPAAGQEATGEYVAGIEPAAGNQQAATCWGDALNTLETGAVTYNFGGTFEESLAAQSGCASSTQGT
jgi:hypothetical protein